MKKVDLHIHTVPSIKDANFTFDIDKMRLYVQTLKLDAIAITNHNLFDKNQFDEIKNELNITVFPGVEVDLENGHIIIIADVDSLDKFDDQCNLLKEKIVDNKSVITYDEFISISGLPKVSGERQQEAGSKESSAWKRVVKAIGDVW